MLPGPCIQSNEVLGAKNTTRQLSSGNLTNAVPGHIVVISVPFGHIEEIISVESHPHVCVKDAFSEGLHACGTEFGMII